MDYSESVALITGGSSGIGRATAVRFAELGARVVVAARSEKPGLEAVEEILNLGGKAVFVQTDVARESDVETMVSTALSEFGRLDFAVNSASVEGPLKPIAETLAEEWDIVCDANLKGTFLCVKHEAKAIRESGKGGAIVNVGSVNSRLGFPGATPYVASKHGQVGITRCAAAEYAADGIRVNIVCPGIVQTPMHERLRGMVGDELIDSYAIGQRTPLGRKGTPHEIARTIVSLCSDDTSYVTGAEIYADGGWTAT